MSRTAMPTLSKHVAITVAWFEQPASAGGPQHDPHPVEGGAGQRREGDAVSRQAVGRIAWRAQMVLLADRGYSVPPIAAIPTGGEDVVRTWLQRYEQQGVVGLDDHPRSGRPPKERLAPSWTPTPKPANPPPA